VGKSANTGNFAGHSELTHAYCIWFKNMVIICFVVSSLGR
jgi:hypothetical protein